MIPQKTAIRVEQILAAILRYLDMEVEHEFEDGSKQVSSVLFIERCNPEELRITLPMTALEEFLTHPSKVQIAEKRKNATDVSPQALVVIVKTGDAAKVQDISSIITQ